MTLRDADMPMWIMDITVKPRPVAKRSILFISAASDALLAVDFSLFVLVQKLAKPVAQPGVEH